MKHLIYKIACVLIVATILVVAYEARNIASSMNKRRAFLEYYMAINDNLIAIRDSNPPLDKISAQSALEDRLKKDFQIFRQKVGIATDVRIISWSVSNVVFEVRMAGKDGVIDTQDDETYQWDLDKSHPGMSVKQLDALRNRNTN